MRYEIALGALLASAFWLVVAMAAGSPPIAELKDFAGPVATVFTASVAGWVAYTLGQAQVEVAHRNWQTANEKIVLDLFDKRLAIFEEIRSLIGEIVRKGTPPKDAYSRYLRATDRVPYFFGPEVVSYLNQLLRSLIELEAACSMMDQFDAERPKWVNKRAEKFRAIADFYNEAPPLFAAYMKAHQKA